MFMCLLQYNLISHLTNEETCSKLPKANQAFIWELGSSPGSLTFLLLLFTPPPPPPSYTTGGSGKGVRRPIGVCAPLKYASILSPESQWWSAKTELQ